ncbi:MAG: HupE/UreJ family protein [Saccharospirillaceae bacterium]|nr:HupE/UreJ family protein [Saccharospirillaceae bacterium]
MKNVLISAAALLMPAAAFAHTGHEVSGFSAGVAHPFTGLDHLLAMLAVGLWAARQSGAARWATPLAFVAMMAVGALAGASSLQLPFTELMIAASVVVFGALIAFNLKKGALAGVLLAGGFAFFHGFAHGAEMPAMGTLATYGAGFLLATAALHAAGLCIGKCWSQQSGRHQPSCRRCCHCPDRSCSGFCLIRQPSPTMTAVLIP